MFIWTISDVIGLAFFGLALLILVITGLARLIQRRMRHRRTRDIPPAQGQRWDFGGKDLHILYLEGGKIHANLRLGTMLTEHKAFTKEAWNAAVRAAGAYLVGPLP